MIKKILLLTCFSIAVNFASAQRYLSQVFDSVYVAADIQYGFNYNYKGDSTNLYLDIYQPKGDTANNRPVVILAHGGSFVQGSRKAQDITEVCTRLAKMGYVTVSFQYRLGVDILSGKTLEQEFSQAVWRGTQDGRAAVRFIRKQIENGNPYNLNTNQVYSGGISAGGVLGLHLAFLDVPSELSQLAIDTNEIGGIEGNSGNAGYSWKVNGVVSLCGALSNINYINNNKDISICNMHGTVDATVPYKTAYFKFFGADVAILQGGFSVDSAAMQQGLDTRLHTFEGADHVPFSGTTATQMQYMDTTIEYVARYLYKHVTGLVPSGLNQTLAEISFQVFPNPAQEKITVQFQDSKTRSIGVFNMSGQEVILVQTEKEKELIAIDSLPKGMYFMEVREAETVSRKLILVD
jgi:para-nitrobenzyl esterase